MSEPAPPLPPELAQLEHVAAAADSAVDQASVIPGQEPAAPPVDPAEELGSMLTMGVTVAGRVSDLVPKYYPPEACQAIARAYLDCADKYGWTWHQKTGGPEVRLGLAMGVPAFMLYLEAKQRADAAKAKAEADKKAAAGTRVMGLDPGAGGGMPVPVAHGS